MDGDIAEWSDDDIVSENGDMTLSMKYDEKFIYFLVHKENLDFEGETIYIPVDTTQKSGSSYCENFNLKFDRAADFIMVLNGRENSRLMVQERYEVLRSTYSQNVKGFDTYLVDNVPDKDSSEFVNIDMILEIFDLTQSDRAMLGLDFGELTFETGRLKYGNANPSSAEFDSLADFIAGGDYIEVKIPWQLFNFSDPSRMSIHDDYYDGNYGIRYININKMYVGITAGGDERCVLSPYKLKGWGNKVTYHERLKSSYYVMQKLWGNEVDK